jgi:DNA-binding PadR family transcriptional regulator
VKDSGGLGEFEQLVLLAVVRLKQGATATAIRSEIEEAADRTVSRGALYVTLERLERKGYLGWEAEASGPARGGVPARRFRVTAVGLEALRRARAAVARLARGIERLLGEA